METEHPASRYRAGNGALFSATKCPPGPGLQNSCELPFGFLWTPLSPSEDLSVVECSAALPPVTCLTCLAYLNLYADFDELTSIWKCPLCGASNVAPENSLRPDHRHHLSPVVVQPAVEFRQRVVEQPADTASTVIIVMDENLTRADAAAVGTSIQAILAELASETAGKLRVGLVVFGRSVTVYQLGLSGMMASGDVFSEHSEMTVERLRRRQYLADVDSSLHCLWRCFAAVYGIALEDENINGNVPQSRLERLKQRKAARLWRQQESQAPDSASAPVKSPWTVAREHAKASAQPYRAVGEAIQVAIDLSTGDPDRPSRTSRILLFTNGCPNYGDGSVVCRDTEAPERTRRHSHKAKADILDPAKVVRATEYFGIIARAASELAIAIDVLCTGAGELALPVYQALVEPSSGYVLPHASLAEEQLRSNLDYVLRQTFVTGLNCLADSESSSGSASSLRDENWVDGCIIDFRMPSFVTPTHLVGPGELQDDSRNLLANERSSFAIGAALAAGKQMTTNNLPSMDLVDSTMTRIRMGRFDPVSTFSVMLQVNEFFQNEPHAMFQCVVRYVDRDGCSLVTRVYTNRMPMAKDTSEWLDVLDEDVTPVLLGKEAVYRAMFGREMGSADEPETALDALQLESLAYDAQRDLDATIQRISGAYRLLGLERGQQRGFDLTEEGGMKAAGSSIDFAFPPELADALHRLYHFRRGPILSPGPMQSMDDRAEIRSLFIRLPLEDCLGLMALSLWTSGPLAGPTDAVYPSTVPPDTLALWDNCILAGDHYYVLFVWSGRVTLGTEYDNVREALKKFLLERSQNRFPMPTLYMLSEGESMSRRFTALLAPLHGDPVEHQLANFPALGSLSPTELSDLRSQFKFYDPETDASFRNWFWAVASASSSCKDEGISLCD